MKNLKKALKITGITLATLIAILFAAPLLFKGKILRFAKEQINKNLNARTDFSDASISFFRHFPRVSVALEGLRVIGTGDFARDTLISADKLDVAVNIMSIISGNKMKIYSVTLNQPRIHAIVNKEGKANGDISKPDTTAVETVKAEKPFTLELQKYAISNGYISYNDVPGNMSTEISNLNHEGKGDFTADLFTLATHTTADAVTFNYAGIPYLAQTKTSVDADIEIDNQKNQYTFKVRLIFFTGFGRSGY